MRVIGAQRNIRIATPSRAPAEARRQTGLSALHARVWELIVLDLSAPALAPVADWFQRHLPPADWRCSRPPDIHRIRADIGPEQRSKVLNPRW